MDFPDMGFLNYEKWLYLGFSSNCLLLIGQVSGHLEDRALSLYSAGVRGWRIFGEHAQEWTAPRTLNSVSYDRSPFEETIGKAFLIIYLNFFLCSFIRMQWIRVGYRIWSMLSSSNGNPSPWDATILRGNPSHIWHWAHIGDIKCANILITLPSERCKHGSAKLADFGCSKQLAVIRCMCSFLSIAAALVVLAFP